jgi:hypothetical protein
VCYAGGGGGGGVVGSAGVWGIRTNRKNVTTRVLWLCTGQSIYANAIEATVFSTQQKDSAAAVIVADINE